MCREIRVTAVLLFGLLFLWTGVTWAGAGPLFLSGDDADDGGHCLGTACGSLYPKALKAVYDKSTTGTGTTGTRILAIMSSSSSAARTALDNWNSTANGGPGAPITFVTATTTPSISTVIFSNYKMIYVPSGSNNTSGGITQTQLNALNLRKTDIQNFVNAGGGVLALTEQGLTNAYAWFPVPVPLTFSAINDTNIDPTADMVVALPGVGTTNANMDHCCYHTMFTGLQGFPGTFGDLKVLAVTREHNLANGSPGPVILARINSAPVLTSPGNKNVAEGTLLSFTLSATDPDVGQTLTFSISSGSQPGMSLNASTGAFGWTPTEAQGPNSYPVTFRVTDNGAPPLFDSKTITITVTEANTAPTLAGVPAAVTIPELVPYTFTAIATDPDIPVQALTFSLVGAPAGAAISSTGVFTWTPTEAQGGLSPYTFTVRVSDGVANTDASITITVTEVNTPPVLSVAGPQTVNEAVLLPFTVSASDVDLPSNTLTFSASNLPLGATFDPTTQTFSWTPTSAQGGPNPYLVYFTVSDGQFTDTKVVSIAVNDTIADRDEDGIPDAVDNCPDQYNPDQADVCHNSQGTGVTSDATILPTPPTGPITVMATFTFNAGTTLTSIVPPNPFNVICRATSNATGQELQWQTVPEGAPIVLSNQPDGDLFPLVFGTNEFVTSFDLKNWYPNLPEGSYTVVCTYVNFAHIPAPDVDDPIIWMGTADAPPQTIFIGLYTVDSPFFLSPADHEPFNRGRTVPVKFAPPRDSTGAIVTAATIRLFVQRLVGGVLSGNPIPATSNSEIGNVVPCDANSCHYNLTTQPLAIGFWELQAQLDDGTTQRLTIELR